MGVDIQLTPNWVNRPAVLSIDVVAHTEGLASLAERLEDPTPLLNRVARILRRAAARSFRLGGPGWQQLAESTVAAKRALEQPKPGKDGRAESRRFRQQGAVTAAETILVRSGELRDSWVQKRHPDHVEKLDPEAGTVEIGSGLPYAEAHQKGTAPTMIFPRTALALRFIGAGGNAVFARSVSHPGLPPRPVRVHARDLELIREEVRQYVAGPVPTEED